MKTLLYLLSVILLCGPLLGQHSSKWGEPTKKEMELAICPFDTAANAVILAEKAHIYSISGYFYMKIYRKIKILNDNGIEHARIIIPYRTEEDEDNLIGIKAHTLNMENGVLIERELKSSAVSTQTITPYWKEKTFTFPEAREGSILEYRLTFVTHQKELLDCWEFQHPLPTVYSEVKSDIPMYFEYTTFLYGSKLREKYQGKTNKKTTWSLSNMPGYQNEPHVACFGNYINRIKFQWLMPGFIEEGKVNTVYGWEKFVEEVITNYVSYLSKKTLARALLKEIINEHDTHEEKIRKIYEYAHNIHCQYYAYEVGKDIPTLLKSKSGSSADINIFLCLLLKQAGIPAYPVLISTRDNGSLIKEYPVSGQFNHVIAGIEDKGSYKFADATSTGNNWHILPFQDINYTGYMITDAVTKWVSLSYPAESIETISVACRMGTSDLSVQVNTSCSGYYAEEKRKSPNPEKSDALQYFINDILLKSDSVNHNQRTDPYQDYSETVYYSSPHNSSNKIQLNLNLYRDENPFQQKKRSFPVELPYPFSKQYSYNIRIPAGDTITTLPENLVLLLRNEDIDYGKFIYKTLYNENTVKITMRIEMTKTIIPQEYYEYLADFFNQIISKMNEPIIIEKNTEIYSGRPVRDAQLPPSSRQSNSPELIKK